MLEESKLSFLNWHKKLSPPYVVYTDLEALTTEIEGAELGPQPKQHSQDTTPRDLYDGRYRGRSDTKYRSLL